MAPVQFDAREALEVVRALAAVAAADGAVVVREENLLEGFAIQHGIGSHVWINAPLDEQALAGAVTDSAKRREVIRMCLDLAHADGNYADSERALVARIARAFEVSDDELERLTAAVGK
jgi:tellurite resistance protein